MGALSRALAAAAALALVPFAPATRAWEPETRVQMVDAAVRLMPGSLGRALAGHREGLLEGLLRPLTHDGPERRPPWAGGQLDTTLEAEALGLAQALAAPQPFDEIATRFGGLAHCVLEAGFPPAVGHELDGRRYAHFAAFCESRRPRFPLVFYGHAEPRLGAGDWRGFALGIMQRASDDDQLLARAYAAAGDPPDPAAFDDRSVPFALGSLAYSRSVTDVVRAWLAAWERAGGDMGRTPYWRPPAANGPRNP